MRLIGNREYLDISEAAEESGFQKHYIYSLKKRGKVRTRMRDGAVLFDKEDLLSVRWEKGLKHSKWRSVMKPEQEGTRPDSGASDG